MEEHVALDIEMTGIGAAAVLEEIREHLESKKRAVSGSGVQNVRMGVA